MTEELFEAIQDKLDKYQYTSLIYTGIEDISDYEVVQNTGEVVLIKGYNEKARQNEYCWAANHAADILPLIQKENCLITFIPREWVSEFEKEGFEVRNIWHDYFKKDLKNVENEDQVAIELTEDEFEEAVDVTQSCRNQSRGFTGEDEDFIKLWMTEEDDDNINRLIYVEKSTEGKIIGLVCTSTYAQNSEKGPVAWIREVCVRPEFQNKGIARKLIRQALAHGKRCGATRAFLAADEQNANAIHLYTSLGFEPSEEDGQIDMTHR